ncbi:hypothetical protein [Rubrobacter tropicus]|nr:hypothetical protein [Rubrobacter tropicus]
MTIGEGLKTLTEDSALPDRAINKDEVSWTLLGVGSTSSST